jgi:hypothetical protein
MATTAIPIPNAKYEIRPPKPSTKRSPTATYLLNNTPDKDKVSVTVPTVTRAYNIAHEAIHINKRKYEPGKTYRLHPDLATELKKSIENFEEKIVLQVTKGQGSKAQVPMLELTPEGDFPANHVIDHLSD